MSNTSIELLQEVFDFIASVVDPKIFSNSDICISNYSDEQLAELIEGNHYNKVKQKIQTIKTRQEEKLNDLKQLISQRESEHKNAKDNANLSAVLNAVNLAISDSYDLSDHRLLQSHDRRVDKSNYALERYENEIRNFQEKVTEFKEQIEEKEEELKPALDRDIAIFISKIYQAFFETFHDKEMFFEAFILFILLKRICPLFRERVDEVNEINSINEVFRQINREVKELIDRNCENIVNEFEKIIVYLRILDEKNKLIVNEISVIFEKLPYDFCDEHIDVANSLFGTVVNTNITYDHIIESTEIIRMQQRIKIRQDKLHKIKNDIDYFLSESQLKFNLIDSQLNDVKEKVKIMQLNEEEYIKNIFNLLNFVLDIFNKDIQKEYLKSQKSFIDLLSSSLSKILEQDITQWKIEVFESHFYINTIEENIATNKCFNFFLYKQKLQNKKRECLELDSKLREDISILLKQPKKKSDEYTSQLIKFLLLALLPIVNIFSLFYLHKLTKAFLPALSGKNSTYSKLRYKVKLIFTYFVFINLGAAFFIILFSLITETVKFWYIISASYIVFAIILKLYSSNNIR